MVGAFLAFGGDNFRRFVTREDLLSAFAVIGVSMPILSHTHNFSIDYFSAMRKSLNLASQNFVRCACLSLTLRGGIPALIHQRHSAIFDGRHCPRLACRKYCIPITPFIIPVAIQHVFHGG